MTRSIASVGALMLDKCGFRQLDDLASEYIPAFKQLDVFESGDVDLRTKAG